MKLILVLFLSIQISTQVLFAQDKFSNDPSRVQFVTSDVQNFWLAFEAMERGEKNPFEQYIAQGSERVQGFLKYRIVSAEKLHQKVLEKKEAYLSSRNVLDGLPAKEAQIMGAYQALKQLYPEAVFPPVYFVVGRFNSGGTVSKNGLILGVEMMKDLEGLVPLVAHELIHFQQKQPLSGTTLLEQCILEGGADFLGEMISGVRQNPTAYAYGERHEERICQEFVQIMHSKKHKGWLYGSPGKDDRPNDLGYWMGYKIVQAYYEKGEVKKKAIAEILDISNSSRIMAESGYLSKYLGK